MKQKFGLVTSVVVGCTFTAMVLFVGGCGGGGGSKAAGPVLIPLNIGSPSPAPSGTPGPSPTPGPSSTPTPHPTPTPSNPPSPTPTPTSTPTMPPTPTPPPSPTPMPISQKHVQTWLIIGEPGGTYSVSPAQVSQWVDYVMTTPALSSAAQAAGEKSVLYSDPNRQAPGGPMWTNDETTFAHDCNGNRITVSGSNTYLMDVHSTHLWALWPAFVAQTVSWGGVWSYIFEDSADEINTQRLSQLPCNFDQTDWTNNTNLMDQALGQTNIIYNGLGLIQGGGTQPGPAIGLNPTTQGGMSEDCYVGRTPTGYFYAPHWEASENTELQMAQQGKLFICHADAYTDASQSQLLRTYFYASFLLTYDRSTQIVNTEFLTPSGVTVMPEAQLVPTQPIQSSPGDISGLMQSSGVYGREYRACYLAGNYAGPCAAVVNPNHPGMQMAFPWPTKYHHTLAMSGYGVYDGGTVSTNGAAPPAMMDGGTAQIVFP